MNDKTAQQVADILKAVAHPLRLQIVELLESGERCVGDIVRVLKVPQSVASQQLTLMKDKQVLKCRRDGTKSFYSIKNLNVISVLHCVNHHCEKKNDVRHPSKKGRKI
jgi:DNA-binding transcriptional ArsR family regulator